MSVVLGVFAFIPWPPISRDVSTTREQTPEAGTSFPTSAYAVSSKQVAQERLLEPNWDKKLHLTDEKVEAQEGQLVCGPIPHCLSLELSTLSTVLHFSNHR